ncbi:alcohol dehydrogenase [Pyronema domesticum]|uniref:Similar to S-(Hydroxymethyl)glutathione dehydrogenase acc. no. P47734 n=1 Tax=Pyronema omphalodes (strain CBS 100304) TaxID=1076935 RepID=U4KY25_PYROM|nr:alcohol dehydrogenase [Pyronema domesticum]CCX06861.1 Similar to S-(hydroxymethyl)glutathione dehydrogenase; acc. no. P47734 [Pyronema omphalodes CBS 100304]
MAMNAAANLVERIVGHQTDTTITTNVSNPNVDIEKFADTSVPMKALAWQGKNHVEIIDTYKPKLVDPGDVILKVTGSTLCGSDLHLYHGSIMQMQSGDILGHEFCGIVHEVGTAVKKVQKGKRYVASFQIACGECKFCVQKLSSQCDRTNDSTVHNALFGSRTAGLFGYSHFTGGYAGGQAEWVRVPYGDVNLLELPDEVPDEKGLYLSDVLSTSYNAVQDTRVYGGDSVAIWGAGPIGLIVAMFALKNGASRVILIDNNWRLKFCKEKLPNIETLDYTALPKGKSVTTEIHERVPGGVDVCIECVAGEYAKGWAHYFEMMVGLETDTSEILNEMITSCRKFGRCGITGAYVGFTNHFNIGSLMERGIRLIGNGQAPVHKYWEEILEMIKKDEIDPTIMLTHRIPLEDLAKAYKVFDERKESIGMMKIFVETKFSGPVRAGPALSRL